ncbi:class I SAM-dependent methyltransferase [Oceanobacillus chungangensis]|uniref:Class I SAM-dependent methyltransferase n=1 Tax=Oceanobacillus chungangensis TaxID=1229152 RepID=A0A3D8PIG5_9BACI|nr:class I SAM-dependent methyltransferase [Oceanobacillus chungangensis]RDW15890.1 class I SAM-dependent methyltransferase [Oceanobacillus chungangensis]
MIYTYMDFLASFGVGGAHPGGLQLTKHILSTENVDATKHILDAGCGTGQTASFIAENYACPLTAIDKNNLMLEKANKRFSSLSLPIRAEYADIEQLQFDDESFDLVLSESVLAFTTIPVALNELKRVLKPGGTLIAVEIVLEQQLPESEWRAITEFYGFTQLLTDSSWDNLLKQAGFRQIIIEPFNYEIDKDNVENAPDFSPSDNIDDQLIKILDNHQHLSKKYKNILGFRVFRCS